MGVVPMLGIGFHSFIDGFIYSIAFTVSILTGSLATLGMVLHEFPEGIVTYLLLLRGGVKERQAMAWAFLAAAATTPLGMLVSYPLISEIEPGTLGALLAVSAGALVYVGATHLLPKAEQENKRFSLVALAGGVLVAVIMGSSMSCCSRVCRSSICTSSRNEERRWRSFPKRASCRSLTSSRGSSGASLWAAQSVCWVAWSRWPFRRVWP